MDFAYICHVLNNLNNMKYRFLTRCLSLLSLSLATISTANAQNVNTPTSPLYQEGVRAFEAHRFQEAAKNFNQELSQNPNNGYAHLQLARCSMNEQNCPDCVAHADKALSLLPRQDTIAIGMAYNVRAVAHECLQDTLKAFQDYSASLEICEMASTYRNRAELLTQAGELDMSDQDLFSCLTIAPDDSLAYIFLANNAKMRGLDQEVVEYCTKALERLPKHNTLYRATTYDQRAVAYIALGDNDNALKDFDSALKLYPNTVTFLNRAKLYSGLGQSDLSDNDLRQCLLLNPNETKAYLGLAYNAFQRKDYAQNIDFCNKALAIDPSQLEAYRLRISANIALANAPAAISDAISAYNAGYERPEFDRKTLPLFVASAFPDQAIEAYIAEAANNPDWYLVILDAYSNAHRFIDAINLCKLLIDNNIHDAEANLSLSGICYNFGLYDRALQFVDRLYNKTNVPELISLKAAILDDACRFNEALTAINDYIKQVPDDGEAYYDRGMIYKHLGDEIKAAEEFNASITNKQNVNTYAAEVLLQIGILADDPDISNQAFELAAKHDLAQNGNSFSMVTIEVLCRVNMFDEVRNLLAKLDDDNSADDFYNAARIFALMGDRDATLTHLNKALELGFRHFSKIDNDNCFDSIRNDADFNKLISECKAYNKGEIEELDKALSGI